MRFFEMDMRARASVRLMGVVALVACALVLGGALAFEHIGGLLPCRLCLQQRIAYAVVIVAALALCLAPQARFVPVFLFVGAGVLFAGGLVGGYQAGLEWGFWEGGACGGMDAPVFELGRFQESLTRPPPPPCDEAAWTLFSISLAGYNVLVSLVLVSAALYALGAFLRKETA